MALVVLRDDEDFISRVRLGAHDVGQRRPDEETMSERAISQRHASDHADAAGLGESRLQAAGDGDCHWPALRCAALSRVAAVENVLAMVRRVELEAVSATALTGLIERGVTTAVVPFGSVEHHGGHLPLGADALVADALSAEVAGRLDAVLAPTVRVGDSSAHMNLPGTISVSAETLTAVAFELSLGLARTGFAVVALVSTHGGNSSALDAAVLNLSAEGILACAPTGDLGPTPGSYSGEWLTSVMLAVRPELVNLRAASAELRSEVDAASAERGRVHAERFVVSCVGAVLALGS